MSSEQLAAVIEAIARPNKDFAALDSATIHALKKRVVAIVTPSSGPASGATTPPSELRAIGVPTHWNWNELKTLPMLLAEVRSNQREWEVHSGQNRFFLLSNLDSGASDVIAPLDFGRRMPVRPPSRSGTPPDAFNAALSSAGVLPYNLLRWFSPQQFQGRLAITAFDYDLFSNTVRVDVVGGPGGLPVSGTRVTVRPRPATTTFETAGVRVQWPPTIRPGGPGVVHVDLKMPRDQVAVIEWQGGAEATLVASLLMLPLDKSPALLHVQTSVKPNAGSVAAAFDVELNAGSSPPLPAGAWLGYLILGEAVIGPYPFHVEAP